MSNDSIETVQVLASISEEIITNQLKEKFRQIWVDYALPNAYVEIGKRVEVELKEFDDNSFTFRVEIKEKVEEK